MVWGHLGVIGKYGMYRFNNMLSLVDSHNRELEQTKRSVEGTGRITHGTAIRLLVILSSWFAGL